MLPQRVRDGIDQYIPQGDLQVFDETGDIILSKPHEGINTNICGDGEERIALFSNASIGRTGLQDMLDWFVLIGLEYNYSGPGISQHGWPCPLVKQKAPRT
jgi:hypothetical protein